MRGSSSRRQNLSRPPWTRSAHGRRRSWACTLRSWRTLVQRYPPGASIGWHRDAPAFGAVIGISLLSSCRMRFQRGSGQERQLAALDLPPRSVYVLDGSVRTAWQHSIPPT
ncbi:MAG TPA: alpha-ketoglutarate-dependent dioxygenase AlkB, partial [Candidatus Dormibacteraeota bacterium]|nr:alpha-ketoglutarate-dependent dioxygenase AlkB [Candidatus Dormibacteraeota bacterium]